MRTNSVRLNAAHSVTALATCLMRMDQRRTKKKIHLSEKNTMTNQRTPHSTIQLRFLLSMLPFALGFAILLAPWFFLVLAVCLGASLFWFHAARLFNYAFVKLFDPVNYDLLKQNGGDSFYDTLGPPFNFDSDSVRKTGREDY